MKTDAECKNIVLRKFYELRHRGPFQWPDLSEESFDFNWAEGMDLPRISSQLADSGLLDWRAVRDGLGRVCGGYGEISAAGVDVIEGDNGAQAPTTKGGSFYVISGSSNVQIGSGNIQDVRITFEQLSQAIDNSLGTDAEKKEAKSRLNKLLEHPLVAAVIGGLASNLK